MDVAERLKQCRESGMHLADAILLLMSEGYLAVELVAGIAIDDDAQRANAGDVGNSESDLPPGGLQGGN